MDRLLNEFFGGNDDAPATAAAEPTAKHDDPDREIRREARQRRKSDPEHRRQRAEFVDRYTTGDPAEGITTEEAIAHLRDMREELSPAEFRAAMQRTLETLPPGQRDDFIAIMRQYQTGQPGGAAGAPASAASPAAGGDPFGGVLTGLLGGSAGGAGGVDLGALLDDLQQGGVRAPSSAPGQQPTAADFRTLLESPLGRAVLGGVAAHGIQGMHQEDDDVEDPGTRTRGG